MAERLLFFIIFYRYILILSITCIFLSSRIRQAFTSTANPAESTQLFSSLSSLCHLSGRN